MMMLSENLQRLAEGLCEAVYDDGHLSLNAQQSRDLVNRLADCAKQARMVEAMAREAVKHLQQSGAADLVTFAKQGEPRPSAELVDLSEIMGREKASRTAATTGPEAKLYAFPTVRPVSFDFSQLDNGGDAA